MMLTKRIRPFCEVEKQEGYKVKFFKTTTNIIFTAVTVILAVSLVLSLTVIRKKQNYIIKVKAEIAENQTQIEEAKAKIKDFEAKLSQSEKTNADSQSKLQAAQAEKKRLEDENAKLKKNIEDLKAKKPAAAVPAVSNQAIIPETRRVCYLTFDDGPSANTPKILDILKKYNAKATFFVINTSNKAMLKRIHDEGHTVGLHCSNHDYKAIYTSIDAYFKDLQKISDLVYGATGVRSTVIRFPGGSSNLVSSKYCKGIMTKLVKLVTDKGYSYYDWNISSGDAEGVCVSYTKILNNVLSQAKNKRTACVLMHDAPAKTTTVQALPKIIEGLSAMGFTFEAINPNTYGYHHSKLNN